MTLAFAIAWLAAAAVPQAVDANAVAQPGRDPALLHPHAEQIVQQKEEEQERALRRLLALGGSETEQAEILQRLAGTLRARGLALAIRAQAESDANDDAAAERDAAAAQVARTEAISLYRQLLAKHPRATALDQALFFLADTLQDSGKDDEAVQTARQLTRRFPQSQWAPASHVFIGEHLFDKSKLDEALTEYQAAAQVTTDDVYPYALYKAAWCRFNQGAFRDALELLQKVVAVSLGGDAANPLEKGEPSKVQLAREARRDFVIVYGRAGKPDTARDEFARRFGPEAGRKMLEQYGKLLFNEGRDPEAQLVHRQLLEIHGDRPSAALDETRLLMIAARSGKRKDLLREAEMLVATFQRVRQRTPASAEEQEQVEEAQSHAEETLRNLAVSTHNEARKTQLDDTFAATKALYADYLALFPDAKDAYELRFFDAELLYGLGEKAKAAELYEAVARQDLAALKAGKKPGKWLSKAAWGAVVSRAEVAGDAQPKPGSAPARRSAPQARGSADVAPSPSQQRPITADESKLADACLLYLDVLPEGPHAVEVAFKIGRLEYLAGKLDASEQHLSSIALKHPESELAEYAANLVLDIANLRKDYRAVHEWSIRFLQDGRLSAHGTLQKDLARVEEQSAYALADGSGSDESKAQALLDFVGRHPGATLADKAIFGAAAALSRAGNVDDALAARARLWKEMPGSPLVPRALLASAADHGAVGDFGDAAGLLEKYFAGYRREAEARKWRRAHPSSSRKPEHPPLYDEAKAQAGLHDAAVLREARNELSKALQDRNASLSVWPKTSDHEEQVQAVALLRARLGEISRAARELTAVARSAHGKPALQLTSWREAARLYARVRESGNSRWAWTELERAYRAVPGKTRENLPPEAVAAAAEAHLQLGSQTFDEFKRQRIEPPLMRTLGRKVALLQQVKKRAEETVAMRQADPAVCALAQLGEAQMLLAQAIAQSPAPKQLNQEERKLYRTELAEKAKPLYDEARDTLRAADGKAHELGVASPCVARVSSLLEKLDVKPAPRATMTVAQMPLAATPPFVDADGRPVDGEGGRKDPQPKDSPSGPAAAAAPATSGASEPATTAAAPPWTPDADTLRPSPTERTRRLLDEALLAASTARKLDAHDTDVFARFQSAAEAAKDSVPALLDYAIALDRAGKIEEAEQAYRAAAAPAGMNELRFTAAARAAALAVARVDPGSAASAVQLAASAMPGDARSLQLQADVSLALGDAEGAETAARRILARDPQDVDALCALARAHLALGSPGTAKALALRAAQADPEEAEPLLIEAEIARSRGDAAGELTAVRAAAAADDDSPDAALDLGRVLFERGQTGEAIDELSRAADLAPDAAAVHLALGIALAAADRKPEAGEQLSLAARLAPLSPEPHYELARLHLDGLGDAKAALEQAKLFLRLSTKAPPPGHPIHALLQRCEEALKGRTQASVVQ